MAANLHREWRSFSILRTRGSRSKCFPSMSAMVNLQILHPRFESSTPSMARAGSVLSSSTPASQDVAPDLMRPAVFCISEQHPLRLLPAPSVSLFQIKFDPVEAGAAGAYAPCQFHLCGDATACTHHGGILRNRRRRPWLSAAASNFFESRTTVFRSSSKPLSKSRQERLDCHRHLPTCPTAKPRHEPVSVPLPSRGPNPAAATLDSCPARSRPVRCEMRCSTSVLRYPAASCRTRCGMTARESAGCSARAGVRRPHAVLTPGGATPGRCPGRCTLVHPRNGRFHLDRRFLGGCVIASDPSGEKSFIRAS